MTSPVRTGSIGGLLIRSAAALASAALAFEFVDYQAFEKLLPPFPILFMVLIAIFAQAALSTARLPGPAAPSAAPRDPGLERAQADWARLYAASFAVILLSGLWVVVEDRAGYSFQNSLGEQSLSALIFLLAGWSIAGALELPFRLPALRRAGAEPAAVPVEAATPADAAA